MTIIETCGCGASFTIRDWDRGISYLREDIQRWRADHLHPEPVSAAPSIPGEDANA